MSDRPMHTVPGLFDRLTDLYTRGEQAVEAGHLDQALALFSEGLSLDDHFRQRYVTMYAQRAFIKQRMGDHMGAIPDYGKAIEMEPEINQAQYYFHRGMCFAELGGHAEHAVADYGRSINLHAQHPGPFHLRGKLLATELERYQEAIADFDHFLTMHQHPEVLQLRGFSKLNLNLGRQAIADLQQSQHMRPDVYTGYLLAWAGAIAPDDELFYQSMQAVLAQDPSYRQYFVDNADYARFYDQPRFRQIVG